MHINIKQRIQFDVNGKEFSSILRALKKYGDIRLYESLLKQREHISEQFYKMAKEAREMYIELKTEEVLEDD